MKIFSGSANPEFTLKVANHLNSSLADVEVGKFADGEG